jgi:light-regulated signal transduction histidine kinase (bacteriophytochrome)
MMEMYPGIEGTVMFADLRDCMKTRTPHRLENRFTFPDGTSAWFGLAMEPVPEGAVVLSEDITKEKELEAELRKHREHLEEMVDDRTLQLEQANKELEAFSYSVSHDLRAPLRHIDGFADLLQEHAREALDEKGKRLLTTISEAAKEMGVLIDELLVFSRMGRVEMQQANVDVGHLVRNVIRGMSRETEGRSVEWEIEPLPEAAADPTMLRLVYENILGNAVKYTRTRERARIEIGSKAGDNETIFYVRDNGVGFDMQYRDKLFGVFQRLHSSGEFEGTGIGLANVRRIIQRHGGRTWAEGEVGRGATFYFSLRHIRKG